MDTTMEDVSQAVQPTNLAPVSEPTTIPTLDGWIESLMTCKQLAEVDVQRLCEKVCCALIGSCLSSFPFMGKDKATEYDVRSNMNTIGTRGVGEGIQRAACSKSP